MENHRFVDDFLIITPIVTLASMRLTFWSFLVGLHVRSSDMCIVFINYSTMILWALGPAPIFMWQSTSLYPRKYGWQWMFQNANFTGNTRDHRPRNRCRCCARLVVRFRCLGDQPSSWFEYCFLHPRHLMTFEHGSPTQLLLPVGKHRGKTMPIWLGERTEQASEMGF